jgi:hypothetical protein
MLAEIFLLRLRIMLRAAQLNSTTRGGDDRFVPFVLPRV